MTSIVCEYEKWARKNARKIMAQRLADCSCTTLIRVITDYDNIVMPPKYGLALMAKHEVIDVAVDMALMRGIPVN